MKTSCERGGGGGQNGRPPACLSDAPLFFVRNNVSRRRNARGMVVAETSAAVMTTSR